MGVECRLFCRPSVANQEDRCAIQAGVGNAIGRTGSARSLGCNGDTDAPAQLRVSRRHHGGGCFRVCQYKLNVALGKGTNQIQAAASAWDTKHVPDPVPCADFDNFIDYRCVLGHRQYRYSNDKIGDKRMSSNQFGRLCMQTVAIKVSVNTVTIFYGKGRALTYLIFVRTSSCYHLTLERSSLCAFCAR